MPFFLSIVPLWSSVKLCGETDFHKRAGGCPVWLMSLIRMPMTITVNSMIDPAGVDVSRHGSNPGSNQGKALLAISGSLFWPGVGHFLVGSTFLGLFWFASAIALLLGMLGALSDPARIPLLGILVPAAGALVVIQLIDAFRCSRKPVPGISCEPAVRFAVAAVLMVGAMIGQHRALVYLQNNVYEICYTPTPSMAPILAAGDRFVTLKNVPFHRWDIVGFNAPEAFAGRTSENWMKRVVGLPGEKVEVNASGILINNKRVDVPTEAGPFLATDRWQQPLSGPSKYAANGCWGRPITLGPDEYFLLGDNSVESLDARYWPAVHGRQPGAMPAEEITCKVVAICWPPARWRMFR